MTDSCLLKRRSSASVWCTDFSVAEQQCIVSIWKIYMRSCVICSSHRILDGSGEIRWRWHWWKDIKTHCSPPVEVNTMQIIKHCLVQNTEIMHHVNARQHMKWQCGTLTIQCWCVLAVFKGSTNPLVIIICKKYTESSEDNQQTGVNTLIKKRHA